jgi:hypothetical protein
MAAGVAAATSGSHPRRGPQGADPQARAHTAPGAAAPAQRARSGGLPAVTTPQGAVAGGAAGGSAGGAARPPMSGSTPVHTAIKYSYLSSDGIWLAKHDGLLNLCIIILIVTNFRWGCTRLSGGGGGRGWGWGVGGEG